ncbi:MAG: CoA pyrophosphatase [Pseudomonadota bacterium]
MTALRACDPSLSLTLHRAPAQDPALVDFVWRARRLTADPTALRQNLQETTARTPYGDHVENPGFRPGARGDPRHAAVLFAVGADDDGTLSLLLTERAAHLSSHAGQIALPGGKIEAGETAIAAALREAHEEVALPTAALSVLGVAPAYLTGSGFLVEPVLAVVERGATLAPDPGEVACAFLAPYRHVMTLANHRKVSFTREGWPRTAYEVMVGQRRVWGVTAGILRLIHEKLYAS